MIDFAIHLPSLITGGVIGMLILCIGFTVWGTLINKRTKK